MDNVKGFVSKITSKDGMGKRGKWTVYSMKLELENGIEFEKWISLGFEAPKVKEGDYVDIKLEENSKGFLNAVDIKSLKNPPAKPNRSGAPASGAAPAKAAGTYVSATQTSIHYQSARKDAIEVLKLLQSQDALPLSAAKTKAGEAKRYEELIALVDKLTVQFFYDAETHRLLSTVVDAGKVVHDVGKLPENQDDADETEVDSEETDE